MDGFSGKIDKKNTSLHVSIFIYLINLKKIYFILLKYKLFGMING